MYAIAIMESGNYALNLCGILEKMGYVFEVIATPCQIAKGGCGYCLKFPLEYKQLVIDTSKGYNIKVGEIYKIVNLITKNRYERLD